MSFQNTAELLVYFMRGLEKIPMGRLILNKSRVLFEYTPEFIKTKLEISPLKLPLSSGIQVNKDFLFDGLFGVFNDSLPDGWGRLLLDRKLIQQGINPGELSPLDRLRYVGHRGMGALVYEPEVEDEIPQKQKELDKIAEEILQFEEKDDDQFIDNLLALNGSSAGARPKVLLSLNDEDWIVKFRSLIDPKDIGPIEWAYHLMAKKAHLDVPDAKLFPSKMGPGYFGVKRFDRQNGKCVHMHTMSGLLHADHRFPSLNYETMMNATSLLTKNIRECEKQFRAAVFNILAHNRDDHAKNFSFLMDESGKWEVSPSYDLTFSTGPAGEHCSMIMKEGKNPNLSHLLMLARVGGIKKQMADQIIEEVKNAVSKWEHFAQDAGVSKASCKMIQTTLNRVAKEVG